MCVSDAKGRRKLEETVATESPDLEALLGPFAKEGLRVAMEASGCSFAIHDRLKALGCEVLVWPPKKIRVIAESKAKCDRNDARWLADLLRSGFHPRPVYIPTGREREIRNLLSLRQIIVRSRVRIVQSARSLMVKSGRRLPMRLFHSNRGWKELLGDETISPSNRLLLAEMRDTWTDLTARVKRFNTLLEEMAEADDRVKFLKTMPGVANLTALFMVVGLGDERRFARSREVGSYLGIVPSASDSGKVRRRGHITKEGKTDVRWVWLQAANSYLMSRHSQGQSLRRWFERCAKRRGRKIAIVALARKLMVIAWHIMKERRPFYPDAGTAAA